MAINQRVAIDRTSPHSVLGYLVPGVLALLSGLPIAFLIHIINQAWRDQPEKAVQVVGGFFAILLILPPTIYFLGRRRVANASRLGLLVLVTVSVLVVSAYLYWVSFYVLFPADILIWSEGDFVNDIVKFRVGYPLYTDQANNESFVYAPGSRLLTYLLAWFMGKATSIPLYRAIQLGYTVLASMIAVLCCRQFVKISLPARQCRCESVWGAFWLPTFLLLATNSLTNPFVQNLHDDALAQLISITAYHLLLRYISTQDQRVLVFMALVPGIGFLVKQSLAIWALFYCGHLALFDRPRSLRRLVTFTLVAFAGIGAVIAGSYLLWGDHYIYWTMTVLGSHGVSPLRSFQHLLDAWAYWAVGLLGGHVLLRGKRFHLLLSPWLIWLVLFLTETYTSGIAWMRNHMGPGSLIAGIWLVAALATLWPSLTAAAVGRSRPHVWLRIGTVVATVGLLFGGLGVVRIPISPFSSDAYRYVNDIEKEFAGQPAENVLLDAGTWIYLKESVVMKDRAPSIGERGYSGTGDFSGILQRLQEARYAKVLVRNLHAPDFWYDHFLWRTSSNIRKTLLENYDEIGKIRAVQGKHQNNPYLFSDISILVPKRNPHNGALTGSPANSPFS